MVDFAGEHSSPLRSANRTPVGQSIHSKSNSFCFPYRWLQNMHRENYNHNSWAVYLFFSAVLFCSPFSSPIPLYHKSAEETSSLPKLRVCHFSAKNAERRASVFLKMTQGSCISQKTDHSSYFMISFGSKRLNLIMGIRHPRREKAVVKNSKHTVTKPCKSKKRR